MLHIPFNNQYSSLGESFYTKTMPTRVAKPELIKFNEEFAKSLGITTTDLDSNDIAAFFAGNCIPDGANPLAMAYAGHQFGNFNPQLGDGRAILLGEMTDPKMGNFDLQLKGAGQTYYSRNGDGRAALGPVLREYLLSETMEKLGVPTTRALAAVSTGEEVVRERLLPGGVITRVARSFVRVGTFQFFASRGDLDAVKKLADYVIDRNYAKLRDVDNPYVAFFQAVVDGQAALIAKWMQFGFIHGVMNTDNVSIVCETIDYGPCAFMDEYEQDKVYSSIDRNGRYAYSNQPPIGLWNLTRLAESIVPLFADDNDAALEFAHEVLNSYQTSYEHHWLENMRAKCGLSTDVDKAIADEDIVLIESLLNIMQESHADFTLSFYYLSQLDAQASEQDIVLRDLFSNSKKLDDWLVKWRQRLSQQSISDAKRKTQMQTVNPIYIPRNHQVEAAIRAAEDNNDFSVFKNLHLVLQNPFEYQEGQDRYMLPPKADEIVHQTFCGT